MQTLFQISPVLDMTNFCDRVRLQLVLYRINHWLMQTHRQRVCEDLVGMSLLLPQPLRVAAERERQAQAGAEEEEREIEEDGAAEGRAEPQVRPARRRQRGRQRRA